VDSIKELFRNIFTEPDNATFCIVKIGAGLTVVYALATAAFHHLYLRESFVIQDFGVGMGAVFAGVGVALGLKKDTPEGKL